MKRFAAVLVLVVLPPAVWCQQSGSEGGEELTLERAIALALKYNPQVKNAQLEVEKTGHDLEATRTYRRPSFNVDFLGLQMLTRAEFQFPAGAWGFYPATGPIPAENIPLTQARRPFSAVLARATQPLSQLHRIGLGIRLRDLARDAAREQLRSAQQSVTTDVKKLYFGILQTQSALEATQKAIKTLKELDRVVGESVAQQVALKSDGLEVKARLARTEYDSVSLQHALSTQKEQLNFLLGRDIRTEFRVSPVPEPTLSPVNLAEARTRALAERPDLKEARLRVLQAEQDRRVKKSEFIPDVSLMFGYLTTTGLQVLPRNISAGGFLVSWDVFDWGRKKQELAAKSKTIEQAKTAVQATENQVLVEVESRYRKLEESRRLLQVVQLAQEAAREKLRVATNRYEQRAALLRDALQAEASLAEADYQYQQALSSFLTARADFEKAIGEGVSK